MADVRGTSSLGLEGTYGGHGRPAYTSHTYPHCTARKSAACEGATSAAACDTFERGTVPFAEFLYRENQRLVLEKPRMVDQHAPADGASASMPERGQNPTNGPSVSGPARVENEPTRRHADGAAQKQAIVLNRSRPELVARFMDLYA